MSQEFMAVHYNGPAQTAALLLAVYAIYLQALVVRRVRASDKETRMGWWVVGAACAGTGVWAESMLGLVSMQLPIRLGYVPGIVMGTWLPAVVICGLAIGLYTQARTTLLVRSVGGALIAAGLCLLAVTNVASLVLTPTVSWNMAYMAAAFLITLVACQVGAMGVQDNPNEVISESSHVVRAVLLGGLFRLGQAFVVRAVDVPANAVCMSADQLSGDSLTLMLPGMAALLLIFFHLGVIYDMRAQRQREKLKQSLIEVNNALEDAALQDPLTGLLNRQGFERRLRDKLNDPALPASPPSVYRLSLDGFRHITETFGDALSDAVLRHIASRMRILVRANDVLARADADEFLLLSDGVTDELQVAQLAQRLGELVRQPCMIEGQDITVSCSIGIARYPESATADQLLTNASDAMQTARRAGGAVYCIYHHGMDRQGVAQVELQRDLRHALARNELTLYFQPKLRADTGELAGVEALVRWMHPQRGMISPTEFIPVAERFGLIGELGMWVLEEACSHIRRWHEGGLDIAVAVNVSAHQLRQPDLETRVREILKRHRIPASMLILEITESVAMEDIDASLRVFDMLDDIGVRLSIDDFGTGYSSLSYLRRLPARQLKIDRSFIQDLETSRDAQAIVEAVVRLAHALGLKVVAEGVETEGQADIVRWLACDEIQGFLCARPMPEVTLLQWVLERARAAHTAPQPAPDRPPHPAVLPVMKEVEEETPQTAWTALETTGV